MTAAVIPFPITRRHGFVRKQAAHAASMNPDSAVRYIQHQLLIQRDAMRRRGIDENLIARELRCMATAMHTEFLQATSAMGGR
jgi:Family of unknown function (DUF6074)